MADTFTKSKRSQIMRQVRSRDTKPELIVRRLLHRLGYRYRLHDGALPGKPDLVFPSRGKVVFVHGCFWHQHRCRRGRRAPATNQDYWLTKLARNKERDRRNRQRLRRDGWDVLAVWECQMRDADSLADRLVTFLEA